MDIKGRVSKRPLLIELIARVYSIWQVESFERIHLKKRIEDIPGQFWST
jgi:hypothetical protein